MNGSALAGKVQSALAWRWWYYGTQLGRGVLAQGWKYPRLFSSFKDMSAYASAYLSLDASPRPVTLRVKGVGNRPLLCRPRTSDPWVMWDVFDGGFHLPPVDVPPDGCIVDLGANVGYTTAHFAHLHPRGRVVAVEMDAANADLASRNVAAFGPRCQVLRAAVWSEDGEITYEGGEEQGMRVAGLSGGPPSDPRKAPARSIDSIFREFDLQKVDYLKMDIEGAESAVFASSLDWARRVGAMQIELHPPADFATIAAALTALGFCCHKGGDRPLRLVAVRGGTRP